MAFSQAPACTTQHDNTPEKVAKRFGLLHNFEPCGMMGLNGFRGLPTYFLT
jgi:hypothetical protein